MTLLDKLQLAVDSQHIPFTFTTKDFKKWVSKYKVKNDKNNSNYRESYLESFLSASVINSTSTKWDKKLKKFNTSPESYTFI